MGLQLSLKDTSGSTPASGRAAGQESQLQAVQGWAAHLSHLHGQQWQRPGWLLPLHGQHRSQGHRQGHDPRLPAPQHGVREHLLQR